MQRRPVIDVSGLPGATMDSTSPLWWGNLLMIFIETTTIILLLTSYYYIRRNYEMWPPPRTDPLPSIINPVPDRFAGTWNTVLLVGSCLPMYLTNQAARRKARWPTLAGLGLMLLVTLISTWLRMKEFPSMKFSWGDNAYASVVWILLGMHLIYLFVGMGEFIVMGLWVAFHDIDEKHALDVTLAGGYWYWVAGIWLLVYVTIYFGPTFLQ